MTRILPLLPMLMLAACGGGGGGGDGKLIFATLSEARDSLRASGRLENMSSDIYVDLLPGDERVGGSPIRFGPRDSGTNGWSVIYRVMGAPGSHRVLGSRVVTGWQRFEGSIYRAQVGPGLSLNTMWEDGTRARLARSPKLVIDASFPMARAAYLTAEGVLDSNTVLQYAAGDLSPASWDLSEARVTIFSGGLRDWFSDTIPIQSVDVSLRQLTLSQQTRYFIFSGGGSRYFVEGVLDLLTEPGEFHYSSTSGYLYYWPIGSIDAATIEIPTTKRVIEFVGDSESARVHNIVLDGLGIEQSDWTKWYRHAYVNDNDSGENHIYPGYDRQVTLPENRQGAVALENADHITLTRCRIKNAGFSCVYGFGYNQAHNITHSAIEHCGLYGIYIEGKYPAEGDVSFGSSIHDCKIHDVGELGGEGGGIALINSGRNSVTNCEIYRATRYGTIVAAYRELAAADVYARDNRLSYLKIHDVCQDSGDTAAVYAYGLGASPTVTNYYDQITIDNVAAHPSVHGMANGGFYGDQNTNESPSNIWVTNTPGPHAKIHLANLLTQTNCSWFGGFDSSLIETSKIGVTAEFPY